MSTNNESTTFRGGSLTAALERTLHVIASLELWRVALTVVSGITTLLGLMLLYDTLGGEHGGSTGWLRFGIPISLAGALHAIIFWALQRWSTTRRHWLLAVAIPLQILAIGASYGTHWVHMRGSSEALGSYVATLNSIDRGLRSFQQSYQAIATATNALDEHSEERAKTEAKSGNSCGVKVDSGEGPRHALRMSDRDTYRDFNREVAKRKNEIAALIAQLGKADANSAEEAMSKLGDVRRVVNQAKPFETDPLLARLRQTAQQRLAIGRGAIDIPPAKRGKSGAASFTCPDAALERHLSTVIDTIAALKPVPEMKFEDSRDPRVGFTIAMRRLAGAVMGAKIFPQGRLELKAQRSSQLAGSAAVPESLRSEDVMPLVFATVIELALTLLFMIRGGTLPGHPGIDELAKLARRQSARVFDSVWASLGGSRTPGAVCEALRQFIKFEGRSVLVVVPVYSNDRDARCAHSLMLIMVGIGMANRFYSGRLLRSFVTFGWPKHLRAYVTGQGSVHVYRMSYTDYLAFVLDAIDRSEGGEAAGDSATTTNPDAPADRRLKPEYREAA